MVSPPCSITSSANRRADQRGASAAPARSRRRWRSRCGRGIAQHDQVALRFQRAAGAILGFFQFPVAVGQRFVVAGSSAPSRRSLSTSPHSTAISAAARAMIRLAPMLTSGGNADVSGMTCSSATASESVATKPMPPRSKRPTPNAGEARGKLRRHWIKPRHCPPRRSFRSSAPPAERPARACEFGRDPARANLANSLRRRAKSRSRCEDG